jgi:hypothetical protein
MTDTTDTPPYVRFLRELGGGSIWAADAAAHKQPLFEREPHSELYEIERPSVSVTYCARNIDDATRQAERIGVSRFYDVAPDGTRTPLVNGEGQWRREAPVGPKPKHQVVWDEDGPSPEPLIVDMGSAAKPADWTSFDPQRAESLARLEAGLRERYDIKLGSTTMGNNTFDHTFYCLRGADRGVAIVEFGTGLTTYTNNPSEARSLIDIAQMHDWRKLNVSGDAVFRRTVWLEASARDLKVIGYEPTPSDMEVLKGEQQARVVESIGSARHHSTNEGPNAKASGPVSRSREAVSAAIKEVLHAHQYPEPKRSAVMEAVARKLDGRERAGKSRQVAVFDNTTASQRTAVLSQPDVRRSQQGPEPTR